MPELMTDARAEEMRRLTNDPSKMLAFVFRDWLNSLLDERERLKAEVARLRHLYNDTHLP